MIGTLAWQNSRVSAGQSYLGHLRHELRIPLRYRLEEQETWCTGETINMSESGLLFTSNEMLEIGRSRPDYLSEFRKPTAEIEHTRCPRGAPRPEQLAGDAHHFWGKILFRTDIFFCSHSFYFHRFVDQ